MKFLRNGKKNKSLSIEESELLRRENEESAHSAMPDAIDGNPFVGGPIGGGNPGMRLQILFGGRAIKAVTEKRVDEPREGSGADEQDKL